MKPIPGLSLREMKQVLEEGIQDREDQIAQSTDAILLYNLRQEIYVLREYLDGVESRLDGEAQYCHDLYMSALEVN